MKIKGIGVDLENISRIRCSADKKNFYKKIFTKKEIKYCLSKSNPYQHFAARYCAKEAFAKATDEKIKDLKDIEIVNDLNGRPHIKYKNFKVHLSLSHTKDIAVAFIIIEK